MDAPAPDDGAAGRRRRGLILAGVVLVVGVPITLLTWWSERSADQRAAALAEDVRIAGRLIDEPGELWLDTIAPSGDGVHALKDALGHENDFVSALFDDGSLSAVYRVRWGLAQRCVHLLVSADTVRTDITDSTSCSPRTP